jgi:hypothetical protein
VLVQVPVTRTHAHASQTGTRQRRRRNLAPSCAACQPLPALEIIQYSHTLHLLPTRQTSEPNSVPVSYIHKQHRRHRSRENKTDNHHPVPPPSFDLLIIPWDTNKNKLPLLPPLSFLLYLSLFPSLPPALWGILRDLSLVLGLIGGLMMGRDNQIFNTQGKARQANMRSR